MRISILVSTFVLVLSSLRTAAAIPRALYNPATGNVQIVVDRDRAYGSISIVSQSGSLTHPNELIEIPGSFYDLEFPFAYTCFALREGVWNTGNTVIPNTPVSSLALEFFWSTIDTSRQFGEIIVIPEPAAQTLVVAGLAAVFRRRR